MISEQEAVDTIPLRNWFLAGFIASFYPLLGFKRTFSIIGIVLAIWGLILIFRRGRQLLDNPAVSTALLVAACFWLPLLTALPDAEYPAHSAVETLKALLSLPILISMITLVQDHRITRPFLWMSIATVAFWVLDALTQQILGQDLFGRNYSAEVGRIGAYWLNQAKFGYYMGFYGLFALAALMTVMPARRILHVFAWLFVTAAVLISGNREAWLMFFPFSILLFWVHIAKPSRHPWLLLLGAVLILSVLGFTAWELSETVQNRVTQSLQGFSLDYDAINKASSQRLGLWSAAVELFMVNWFNGMGLEGFQLAFPGYTDDPYWRTAGAEMYTHQYILEILTSTGLIGLAGLIAIMIIIGRTWHHALPTARTLAWPALIYLAALWFPLNTHRSFYSSELMMGNWIMLGMLLGNLLPAATDSLRPASEPT